GGAAVRSVITGSAVLTCLGDGVATFSALLRGATGVGPLRGGCAGKLSVTRGYHIDGRTGDDRFLASRWLTSCLRDAVAQSALDPASCRVVVIVGTGLRELGAVESGQPLAAWQLHFGSAPPPAIPQPPPSLTLSNP